MVFNKHVKLRNEKFGSVIFETLKEKVYVTNETGRDILRLIKDGEDKDGIARSLCGSYEGNPDSIKSAVTMFINQLKEKGLIAE